MYSILPASVANELRHHRPVPARKYENVTILFSGISGFSAFCAKNSDSKGAMQIVQLLNSVYTKFDDLFKTHLNVYKVLYIFVIFIPLNVYTLVSLPPCVGVRTDSFAAEVIVILSLHT